MSSSVTPAAHGGNGARAVDWLAIWILVSASCTLSGWFLSLLGCLNIWGYSCAFILLSGSLWLYRKPLGFSGKRLVLFRGGSFHPHFWLPKAWLLLTLLVFVGGAIHHPNNYDHLSYRFTRVLHWSWEQRWYWIDTPNMRQNLMATGFEWLMTPVFVFFQTDRLFFLINIISYLLLPGVIFSVFCQLGICKRVSWWWMWMLPTGYCYLLQAGSVSSDLFSTVYLLASFLYILKAGEEDSPKNIIYAVLAIALATGTKASNVPLILPWLVAAFMKRRAVLKCRPEVLVGTIIIAAVISFLPIALINTYFTGDYTGDPHNLSKIKLDNPISGLLGNSIQIAVANVWPPIWPEKLSANVLIPASLKAYFARTFPCFDVAASAGEVQIEESAGIGLGITLCLGLMIALRCWAGAARPALVIKPNWHCLPVFIGTLVALTAFLARFGNQGAPRYLTPYYPLVIAGLLLLLALDGTVMRFSICNIFAFGVMLAAVPLIIISPARPLFPTELAAHHLAAISPASADRMQRVYEVYGQRYDSMKDVLKDIPNTEKSVGLIQTGDIPESVLWRPYGLRRIVDVKPDTTLEQLKADHIRYIIVDDEALIETYHTTLESITQNWLAVVVDEKEVGLWASRGKEPWHIIALQ